MTILVGYLPTPLGEATLEKAIEEARLRDEQLLVLSFGRGDAAIEPQRPSEDALDELRHRLELSGVPFELRAVIHPGDAGEELVKVAREEDVALIVVGIRRRSPVGKFLTGSTAQHVLLHAHCPVLGVTEA